MKMKSIGSVMSIFIILTALVGCGTQERSVKEPTKVVNGSDYGIVAGKLTSSLEKVAKDNKLIYIFTIKNDQDKADTLKYSSSQKYDFKITDSSGQIVYTYSMAKLFGQMMSEEVLNPGEEVTFEINLSDELLNVKPGTYEIEIWSVAEGRQDLRAKAQFNWSGASEGGEVNPKMAGATVTYIGLMDNNSIEVINEEGEYDHYRLSEEVKPEFDSLEKNTKINIGYGIVDGQKTVLKVIKQ